MTQEDKELLFKDLCARLPYGVNLRYIEDCVVEKISHTITMDTVWFEHVIYGDADVKPYLRPMSSMTEEEVKEIRKINWQFCKPNNVLFECFVGNADDGYCSISQMAGILDYLNAHHFDYNGLIEKGLALEAPEEMYK